MSRSLTSVENQPPESSDTENRGTVLVRSFGEEIGRCLLTHMDRQKIDVPVACGQHDAFVRLLGALGARVEHLPLLPDCPDAVFVEDTAVVLPEVAVLCSPSSAARRGEVNSVGDRLQYGRSTRSLPAGASLEGGDVVRMWKTLFVGCSTRSDRAGIEALATQIGVHGYTVRVVDVEGALHLKTGATVLPDGAVLLNPRWVDASAFGEIELLEVDPNEPWAANTLSIGEDVIVAAGAPRTVARLRARGLRVVEVEIGELQKAEAGVSCLALPLSEPRPLGGAGSPVPP